MRVKTRLVDSKLGQLSEPPGSFKDLCLSQSVTIASVSGRAALCSAGNQTVMMSTEAKYLLCAAAGTIAPSQFVFDH